MTSDYLRETQNYPFTISHEKEADELASAYLLENILKRDSSVVPNNMPVPLTTSKFANQAQQPLNRTVLKNFSMASALSNHGRQAPQSNRDTMLANLSEKCLLSEKPKQINSNSIVRNVKNAPLRGLNTSNKFEISHDDGSFSGDSSSLTPSSDTHSQSFGSKAESSNSNNGELQRLKEELAVARCQIARMDLEISQNKITKHTIDQALGSASDQDFFTNSGNPDSFRSENQVSLNGNNHQVFHRNADWYNNEYRSEPGGSSHVTVYKGSQASCNNALSGSWQATSTSSSLNSQLNMPNSSQNKLETNTLDTSINAQTYSQPAIGAQQHSHRYTSNRTDFLNRAPGNFNHFDIPGHSYIEYEPKRFPSPFSRPNSAYGAIKKSQGWTQYINDGFIDGISPSPPLTPASCQPSNAMPAIGRPMSGCARLSPTAAEFRNHNMLPTPWNAQVPNKPSPNYAHHLEPVNYRKLLDRNMGCNWKLIVDKIVGNNDQQASIFLQQKLKTGTSDHKFEIVEAIIAQAYPLMVNRFGNFLVQRCFEHGTTRQIIAIANAIRGNTLNLSMDAFGCHVIQKAFDCVPEEHKAIMVHELLRRIPETVIHRYACHVWQKLFELRWSDSPPQIMKYVNESLRGMWHEVALGETGSLVVQNVFENCLEEDKRPCINEVLASIDVIAHGQFGNWCIQHICEHGSLADRNSAIDHIICLSVEYSMDQYASKVVEKCLKVCGTNFLDRYLGRICEGRPDRPRMPLIDIAGDQFGNYLIQYILIHASPQHREVVATHVRKHMVSLRGSKYGSRVAMLCCNPAFATRPGPPAGMQPGRCNSAGGSGRSVLSTYR